MSRIKSDLIAKIKAIMERNAKSGTNKSGYNYFYTCPDIKIYPHQWFWDSCFHIIINSKLNRLKQAYDELKSLLYYQEEDGWIGHMIYWKKKGFSIVDWLVTRYYPNKNLTPLLQPAFLSHAFMYILESIQKSENKVATVENDENDNNDKNPNNTNRSNNINDKMKYKTSYQLIDEFYQKIKNYYLCVWKKRRFSETIPLIFIIHPWESGTDNIPAYDPVLNIKGKFISIKWLKKLIKTLKINYRCNWNMEKIKKRNYFVVFDVLVNTVFADGLYILSKIAERYGFNEDAKMFFEIAQKIECSIHNVLWSEKDGIYYNASIRYTNGMQVPYQIPVKTVSSFMPLNLPNILPERTLKLIKLHLANPSEFNVPYPIPTVAINDKTFNPKQNILLWRGPTWISTNWYVLKGLEKQIKINEDNKNSENNLNNTYNNNSYRINNLDLDALREIYYKLKNKTIELVSNSGLREYYNPLTSSGYGAKNFGWSGLIIDL
ncbi:MAG: MGH1-like glycoside hydrolase domain-containing protein [Promethearchaeota archaeon]